MTDKPQSLLSRQGHRERDIRHQPRIGKTTHRQTKKFCVLCALRGEKNPDFQRQRAQRTLRGFLLPPSPLVRLIKARCLRGPGNEIPLMVATTA